MSSLPSTDVIVCFNLVVLSGDASLFIFFKPAISLSIAFSSLPVINLYVITVSLEGIV